MIEYEAIYDISILLGVESAGWPGDPAYSRRLHASIAAGDVADVSLLTMTAHTGTHVDAPGHFLPGARKLDDYGPADFVLPAVVIEVAKEKPIPREAVDTADVPPGGAILFKTSNSTTGRIAAGAFFADGVALSTAAAEACVERGAGLVGIDYYTADACGAKGFPVHHVLMRAGVLILETINLRDVPPGACTLICLPLRMAGAEGSPVRAVLLR